MKKRKRKSSRLLSRIVRRSRRSKSMVGRLSRPMRARRGKAPGKGIIHSVIPGTETTSGSRYGKYKKMDTAKYTEAQATFNVAYPLYSGPMPSTSYSTDVGTSCCMKSSIDSALYGADYWTDFLWYGINQTPSNPDGSQPTSSAKLPLSGYQLVADVQYSYMSHYFNTNSSSTGNQCMFNQTFNAKADATTATLYTRKYMLGDVKCVMELLNQTNFACTVHLYEYVARHDMDWNLGSSSTNNLGNSSNFNTALQAWASGMFIQSAGQGTMAEKLNPTTLECTPFMSPTFAAYFKVLRRIEIELGPGCMHIHTVNQHINKQLLQARMQNSDSMLGNTSMGCLIVAYGQPVSTGSTTEYDSTGTSQGTGILDKISTAPVHLFLTTKYTMTAGKSLDEITRSNINLSAVYVGSSMTNQHETLANCKSITYNTIASQAGALT